MKKFFTIVVALIALAAVVMFVTARAKARADGESTAETPPTATVETAPLATREMTESVEGYGVVAGSPSSERTVSSSFDGVVRRVLVSVGSHVAPGDVLLEVEPNPESELALSTARNAAAVAEQNRLDTQHRFELRLATQSELATAEQAVLDARLKFASLEKRMPSEGGHITAEKAGSVSKIETTSGAWVPAGTPLLVVVPDEDREAHVSFESAALARLAPGQSVEIHSLNRPALDAIAGTVRRAGGTIDSASGVGEAQIKLEGPGSLFVGEHVKATVELQRRSVLVAPRAAVLPSDTGNELFTVRDGKAVRHSVKLGLADADFVEVIDPGLHPGDPVAILGNHELEDGMPVRTEKSPTVETSPKENGS